MKKYIVGVLAFMYLAALPSSAMADIAFGASLGGNVIGGTSSLSLTSLSVSGSDLVIIVSLHYNSNTVTASSLNWDDGSGGSVQAFTQLGNYQSQDSNSSRISFWYLANPNTSNSRIIVNNSAATDTYMTAAYYTGVAQSSIFTAPSQTEDTASGGSQLDISDEDGSWHIGVASSANAGLTPAASTTQRVEQSDKVEIVDSNEAVADSASHTLNWSWGGGSAAWVTAMMRPAATTTPPADPITGSGTTNRLAKFTASTEIGDALLSDDGSNTTLTSGNFFMAASSLLDTITNGAINFGTTMATTMTFGRSGQNLIMNSNVGIGTSTPSSKLHVEGEVKIGSLSTISNCISSASPAVCANSSVGSVAMATGTSTLTVNTTSVTANSQILITEDFSLGSRLGITCNTNDGRHFKVSARTAGTSFTIRSNNNPTGDKACLSYLIVN